MCHHGRGRDHGPSWKEIAEEDPEHDAEPDEIPTDPPTSTAGD